MTDHHHSARALLIAAAEKSGLLRETAKLLWYSEKYGVGDMCCTGGSCAPCALLDQLIEEFEALAHLPEDAGQKIFSPSFPDAFYISPRPAETHEVDSFVG